MIFWIILIAYIEYYSIGVTILAKRSGVKKYGLCMIPFVSFFYMNKLVPDFKVLSIKVEKWGVLVIELVVISLAAFVYSQWGMANLPEISSKPLTQIMLVPICACMGILYLSIVSSTLKALFLMKSDFKLQWLVCATLLPIPFLLTMAGNKKID